MQTDTSLQPEGESEDSRVIARTILEAVATYHHLPVQELSSRTRRKRVADARHVAMYLLRIDTSLHLKKIGFLLGGRDHSTVSHGVQKILRSLNNNPKLLDQLGRIRALAAKTCTQTE